MVDQTPPTPLLGMWSTLDYDVDERPKDWRQTILYQYPNGTAPLTALTNLMASEKLTDPEFHWWTQGLPTQAATVLGVFTDFALSSAVSAALPIGSTVYVQVSEAEIQQFLTRHTVLLRNATDPAYDTLGLVQERYLDGANSKLRLELLQATPNDSTGTPLVISGANIQRILISGSANPEGAIIGEAVSYTPMKLFNYSQIFRNPVEITRTAMQTTSHLGKLRARRMKDALQQHSLEMEKAFMWGVPTEMVGFNMQPRRTTGGVIWAIRNGGGTLENFTGAPADWLTQGYDWLNDVLMEVFRYGAGERLAFVGDQALLAINKVAVETGQWTYGSVGQARFGMNFTEILTPFGTVTFKTHPLFSYEPTNRKSMVIIVPKNIRYRYVQDTTYKTDPETGGHNSYDGIKEEYLTECGLEYHFPNEWAYLGNIGGAA